MSALATSMGLGGSPPTPGPPSKVLEGFSSGAGLSAPLFKRHGHHAGRRRFGHHGRYGRHHGHRRHGMRGLATVETVSALSGFPDKYRCKLQYVYQNKFTLAGGAITFAQAKLNSAYRPLIGGPATSAGGYQNTFSNYTRLLVRGSSAHVRVFDEAGGSPAEPMRIWLCPLTATQYTAYSGGGVTNISSLENVPHSHTLIYAPNDGMPRIGGYMNAATLYTGDTEAKIETDLRWSSTVNTDPTTIAYWGIAMQNLAGTSGLTVQFEIKLVYYCEFYQVLATPPQQLSDQWGNDLEGPPSESKEESKKEETKKRRRMSLDDAEYEVVQAVKKMKV